MACDFAAMRQRITLQRATFLLQPGGEQTTSWTTVGTYWCQVVNLTGREFYYAKQVIDTASKKILMRNVGPITAEDRFQYTDPNGTTHIWGIAYVSFVDNLNEAYEILVTEMETG